MLPGKLNFGVCDPGPECRIKWGRVLYKTQIMAVLIPSVPPQRAVTSSVLRTLNIRLDHDLEEEMEDNESSIF